MNASRLAMWKVLRVLTVLGTAGIGGYALGMWSGVGVGVPTAQAAKPPVNACGCYRDSAGACFCGKKGKCECPGDCEPKGCEEKRAKEMDKEVEAETKRAREAEKKQRDEAEEKRKKAEAAAAAETAAIEGGNDASDGQSEVEEDDKTKKAKSKKSRKAKEAKKSEADAP
jgi:hypothetical protein